MTSRAIDARTGPLALLIMRIGIGSMFIAHLYWKVFVFRGGFAGWWANFAHGHYPAITPYYVVSAEVPGALLIIPGVWSRWVALYALPMMAGATQFWLVRKGFFFTASGAELPLVWSGLLALLVLFGDGPWALAPSPTPWRR